MDLVKKIIKKILPSFFIESLRNILQAYKLNGIHLLPVKNHNNYKYSEEIFKLNKKNLTQRMKSSLVKNGDFIYICLEDALPKSLYEACMNMWPDSRCFIQKAPNRFRITLGEIKNTNLSDNQKDFWFKFGTKVINKTVKPALIETFIPYLDYKFPFLSKSKRGWIRRNISFKDHHVDGIQID